MDKENESNTPSSGPITASPDSSVEPSVSAPQASKQEADKQESMNDSTPGDHSKKSRKNIVIFCVIAVVAIIAITITIVLLVSNGKQQDINTRRTSSLSEIKDSKVLHFKIGGKEYQIGEKVESLEADYKILEAFSQIDADSIMMTPFERGNDADFLGLIYCASADPCSYKDAKLIKANFYPGSEVEIDGEIGFKSSLTDIESLYGKPVGQYYQDKTMSVWSFGKEVGDPYLVVGFDDGGLFSMGYANRIMLGVWWYEGEFNDTVKKVEN